MRQEAGAGWGTVWIMGVAYGEGNDFRFGGRCEKSADTINRIYNIHIDI